MRTISPPVRANEKIQVAPATARPYLLAALASLSAAAAAIHFAVVFEHFRDDTLYGVFFLVLSWAQLIWPAVLLWRPSRLWLWLGLTGNAAVLAVYIASRTVGLPFGPDLHHPEPVGALDVMSCVLEFALIIGCAALIWRPSLVDWPTHLEDAHAYFWPLWREPLPGVFSYWHSSRMSAFELGIIAFAVSWIACEGRWVKRLTSKAH